MRPEDLYYNMLVEVIGDEGKTTDRGKIIAFNGKGDAFVECRKDKEHKVKGKSKLDIEKYYLTVAPEHLKKMQVD